MDYLLLKRESSLIFFGNMGRPICTGLVLLMSVISDVFIVLVTQPSVYIIALARKVIEGYGKAERGLR